MDSTVIVTGGLGRSGRWIVDRLAADHAVVCVDLDHPGYEIAPRQHVDFRAVDLTDAGETFDLVGEIDPDAVVHWGSHPSPTRHAGSRVFGDNVAGAYNVLVAAGRADATVVQASSESAYGLAFAEDTPLPDELPITEDHPMRPEDPYGTGKVVAEEVADMVHRRDGVPVTSVRPSWIQYPGEYTCLGLDDLADGAGNCWSYVDVRDVAALVARAVDDPPAGHEAVHAAAAANYLGRPTAEAVEEHFGRLPADCDLDGERSALSTAKAAQLFDWTPEHEWRTAREEDVSDPELWS
ncbi:NAD-dependent epimerase/dehydratase family protein [Halobaculum gomorrense]|uniref:Nucleoside-diphosphate-sugar epimerase n=1 Tax=Halobaculum gomorrense TaxID=43928 RepID=A0A1M5QAG5_9EURY|nr:NAD(P)-dependent oxidoreductase [Halobaculum gomorrense]SHH10968.1 Nucleoside-diphosphate-sugar epimerase [Halobaculum gomorrense]